MIAGTVRDNGCASTAVFNLKLESNIHVLSPRDVRQNLQFCVNGQDEPNDTQILIDLIHQCVSFVVIVIGVPHTRQIIEQRHIPSVSGCPAPSELVDRQRRGLVAPPRHQRREGRIERFQRRFTDTEDFGLARKTELVRRPGPTQVFRDAREFGEHRRQLILLCSAAPRRAHHGDAGQVGDVRAAEDDAPPRRFEHVGVHLVLCADCAPDQSRVGSYMKLLE